ncbi:MAG: methionyl-tRNA formyltransferase [Myxococcales bacterium]|nr:methionyl-tRNA formyltransferase [Myxococcales bacterium]
MRVVFFGTPAFAVHTLQALPAAGHEVVAVVAQPDKPAGRGQEVVSPPTVVWARARDIPVFQPTKLKSGDFPPAFAALAPEVAVVVAYGRILPPAILVTPARGCINVHASLLPRWRGAAPIQWAVLAGDEETGVATMNMAEGLDTGDILLVERTPIGPEETAGALFDRLAPLGAALLVRTLAGLDGIVPQPQEAGGVTYARLLDKEMGRLDWGRSAVELHRKVRGLDPWPGTFCEHAGSVLKVISARVAPGAGEPGTILPGARIACGVGALELLQVQAPAKRPVTGADFLNGARLKVGGKLA